MGASLDAIIYAFVNISLYIYVCFRPAFHHNPTLLCLKKPDDPLIHGNGAVNSVDCGEFNLYLMS